MTVHEGAGDESLNVGTLARLAGKHPLLVAASAVLCAAVAVGVAFLLPQTYSVRTELFVSSTGTTSAERVQNGEYARNRVSSYAGLVNSPAVLDVVRDNLGLTVPYYALADDIDASNPLDTALIDITVRDGSAERALAVADQISRVMGPVVTGLESSDGGASPVKVSVVRPPALPTGSDNLSKKLFALAGLVAGAALGLGAAHLRETRPTWSVRAVLGRRAPLDGPGGSRVVLSGESAEPMPPDRRAAV